MEIADKDTGDKYYESIIHTYNITSDKLASNFYKKYNKYRGNIPALFVHYFSNLDIF